MRNEARRRGVRGAMQLQHGALLAALLSGCASVSPLAPAAATPSAGDPIRPITLVSCGGPGFDIDLLDQPGRAETFDDLAAAALRRHLAQPDLEVAWLPDTGWREVAQTEGEVTYVADALPGTNPPYAVVTAVLEGNEWLVAGWAQCRLQASVAPELALASFRVDPAAELTAELTEIPVLVTELACNSGQDARGRIVDPEIVLGEDAVTVVFAVRPRGGDQDCPSNPETPHLLVLSEPLGERALLDGSMLPARDATVCADAGGCAP